MTSDLESHRFVPVALVPKTYLANKYGEFEFFKVTFSKKPSWPFGSHVTSTGLFFDLAKLQTKMVDFPIEPKLTNTVKTIDPKLTRQGFFLNFTKTGKNANTLENT